MSLEEIKAQADLVVGAIQKLIDERDSRPAPEEVIYPSNEMLELYFNEIKTGDVLWIK